MFRVVAVAPWLWRRSGWEMGARFFLREDLQRSAVHPEILREQFWGDVKAEQPVKRYLGIERMRD